MSFFKQNNEDNDSNLLNESQIPNLIKDDKVPVIKDHNGFAIFSREYENRRVVVSNYILKTLVNNDNFKEIVMFFKNKNVIDYMALYEQKVQAATMVNMYLEKEDTYIVPIHFDGDADKEAFDDNINYSQNAKRIENNLAKEAINASEMIFCPVKDPDNGDEYIPLFNTIEELRTIFSADKFRIAKISYKEAAEAAEEYLGLVFRPTDENYIISNDIAQLFSSVSKPSRLCTDYKKYTENEKTIVEKIRRLHSIKPHKPKFNLYFRGILQSINDLNKIYIALSRKSFDRRTGTGTPLITNKDGNPSMYIFSDYEIAKKWAIRYENYLPGGILLLGEVERKNNFDSLFAISSKIGPTLCTLDDLGSFFVFNVKLFMEINNLDTSIKLRVPKDEADKAILNKNKNHINLTYNKIRVLGIKNVYDKIQYTELDFN